MVNYIWVGMTVIGIVFGMINGTMDQVNEALFVSAKEAVTLCLGLMSILVFWLGLMKIAEESRAARKIIQFVQTIHEVAIPRGPTQSSSNGIYIIEYDGKHVWTGECSDAYWY